MDFHEILCGVFLLKSVEKILVWLKSYKMTLFFTNIYVQLWLLQLPASPCMALHQVTIISVTDIFNLVTRLSMAANVATDVLVTMATKVTDFHLPRQAIPL